jgi:glycosyltransferase involved in cell wall biosynthesis
MVQKSQSTASPKVAVITRTKNRDLLLKRALDSISTQTYDNFIQVVVNDGGYKKPVEEIIKNYKHNIKLIHNDKSVGLTKALNQGIRAVSTKYISILDDDDTWSPDRLEKTISYLEKTGAKGVVNVTDIIIEEIKREKIIEMSRHRLYEGMLSINLYKQCLDNYLSNGCVIYERDVYDELKGYNEQLKVAEDWDFGIRFLMKYDVDFLNTNNALCFYHHRPDAKGSTGNSVFDGINDHKRHLDLIANQYLRQDIRNGNLGLGYIINSLRYQKEVITPIEEKRLLEQSLKLKEHVNKSNAELQSAIQSYILDLKNSSISNRFIAKIRRTLIKNNKNN